MRVINMMFALAFTLLSSLLELGLVQVGYMKNITWNSWYGMPVYFVLFFFFFPWFLSLVSKKLVKMDLSKEER